MPLAACNDAVDKGSATGSDPAASASSGAETSSVAVARPGYRPFGDPRLTRDEEPAPGEDPAAAPRRALASGATGTEPVLQTKDVPLVTGAEAARVGAWSAPRAWPLIGIHAALLPDSRVMTYGTDGQGKQTAKFIYDVWDSGATTLDNGHLTLPNTLNTDIFCSSQTVVPSTGELLLNGGDNWTGTTTTNTGNPDTNLFLPSSNTMTAGKPMNRSRWYSSVTTLPDGRQYIQGGAGGIDRPEVREPDGSFTLLADADTSTLSYYYARNHVAPDGRIFGFDNSGRMYFVDPAGAGYLDRLANLDPAFSGVGSSSTMFEPGRVLHVSALSPRVVEIDLRSALPVLTERPPVSSRRQYHNAVVLPNGRIVVVGGSEVENALVGVNTTAEIYDPATATWTQGATGSLARLYHSTALLLPDATILVAGGGAPGPLVNRNAEIYYPPYLFTAGGGPAVRPVITQSPTVVDPGRFFSLSVQDAVTVSSVVLVRAGSVTHSINFDQRRIPLTYRQFGGTISAEVPASGAIVTPGFYMLFVLDAQGTPSLAKMVRVNNGDPSQIGADWTGRFGGGGGAEFRLECGTGEVLVGVHGNASNQVNRIGPRCVAVDGEGRWLVDPTDRESIGSATGAAFQRTCPSDSAVTGLSARSSNLVDQVTLQCRPLAGSARVRDAANALAPFGGAGGVARSGRSCGHDHPAHALYGRAGASLDSLGLLCRGADPETVNRPPVVTLPAAQSSQIGAAVDVTVVATDPDGDPLAWSSTSLPAGLSISATGGRITGAAVAVGNYQVTLIVTDGWHRREVLLNWSVLPERMDSDGDGVIDADDANPSDPAVGAWDIESKAGVLVTSPVPVNGAATLRLEGTDLPGQTVYTWHFGDVETQITTTPQVVHAWNAPGRHQVEVEISLGTRSVRRSAWQAVHKPVTAGRPISSSPVITIDVDGREQIWNVNPDQDTVSVVDAASLTRLAEIPVGKTPRSLASDGAGKVIVTEKQGAALAVIDARSRALVARIALPPGSMPHGLVLERQARLAWVALEGRGSVVRVDLAAGRISDEIALGDHVRHLALSGDSKRLLAPRFVTGPLAGESTRNPTLVPPGGVGTGPAAPATQPAGAVVYTIDTITRTAQAPITLANDTGPDTEISARGVPNYLAAPAIAPDGLTAVVPFKSDNIFRGGKRDGNAREHDRLVRAKLGRLDLATGQEVQSARIDFDNISPPGAVAFDPWGNYLFVVHEASRMLLVVDAYSGGTLASLLLERAPQGIAVAEDGRRLYVHNFMSRSLSVIDIADLIRGVTGSARVMATVGLVGKERLRADVLLGKQIFHDAFDPRLVSQNYFSCASCHDEAGNDGRTWDMSDAGEGLRNTIDLRGHGGTAHGNVHWSGNFDEIHDFENDIRGVFKGAGLLSDSKFAATRDPLGPSKAGLSSELDALAAYLATETRTGISPYREADQSLSPAARAGRQIFETAGCATCHGGTTFTDSPQGRFHDIGSVDADTGQRLGKPLPGGLDTPTLRGLWLSPPYLHDGSAATIHEAILAHRSSAVGFDPGKLSASELDQLANWLLSIDDLEAAAPGQDSDGDGIPDTVDADDDGDGVADGEDAFPFDGTEWLDTDRDGVGDNRDSDDDGDGFADAIDLDPRNPAVGMARDGRCNRLSNGDFEADLVGWTSSTTPEWVSDASRGGHAMRLHNGWASSTLPIGGNTVIVLSGQFRNEFASGATGWAGFGIDFLDSSGRELGEAVRAFTRQPTFDSFELRIGLPGDAAFIRPWFASDATVALTVDGLDLREAGCVDAPAGDATASEADRAPVVIQLPDQAGSPGDAVDLPLQGHDPAGGALHWSATGLPDGLAIDPSSGRISGRLAGPSNRLATITASAGSRSTSIEVAWVVSAPGAGTLCNLLADGDFENGLGAWQSHGAVTLVADASSGIHAARLSGGWLRVELPVRAGETYRLSGHYRSTGGSGAASMGLDWLDASGNEIAEEVQTLGATDTYDAVSRQASAPAQAAAVAVWMHAETGRTLDLDGFVFRQSECR